MDPATIAALAALPVAGISAYGAQAFSSQSAEDKQKELQAACPNLEAVAQKAAAEKRTADTDKIASLEREVQTLQAQLKQGSERLGSILEQAKASSAQAQTFRNASSEDITAAQGLVLDKLAAQYSDVKRDGAFAKALLYPTTAQGKLQRLTLPALWVRQLKPAIDRDCKTKGGRRRGRRRLRGGVPVSVVGARPAPAPSAPPADEPAPSAPPALSICTLEYDAFASLYEQSLLEAMSNRGLRADEKAQTKRNEIARRAASVLAGKLDVADAKAIEDLGGPGALEGQKLVSQPLTDLVNLINKVRGYSRDLRNPELTEQMWNVYKPRATDALTALPIVVKDYKNWKAVSNAPQGPSKLEKAFQGIFAKPAPAEAAPPAQGAVPVPLPGLESVVDERLAAPEEAVPVPIPATNVPDVLGQFYAKPEGELAAARAAPQSSTAINDSILRETPNTLETARATIKSLQQAIDELENQTKVIPKPDMFPGGCILVTHRTKDLMDLLFDLKASLTRHEGDLKKSLADYTKRVKDRTIYDTSFGLPDAKAKEALDAFAEKKLPEVAKRDERRRVWSTETAVVQDTGVGKTFEQEVKRNELLQKLKETAAESRARSAALPPPPPVRVTRISLLPPPPPPLPPPSTAVAPSLLGPVEPQASMAGGADKALVDLKLAMDAATNGIRVDMEQATAVTNKDVPETLAALEALPRKEPYSSQAKMDKEAQSCRKMVAEAKAEAKQATPGVLTSLKKSLLGYKSTLPFGRSKPAPVPAPVPGGTGLVPLPAPAPIPPPPPAPAPALVATPAEEAGLADLERVIEVESRLKTEGFPPMTPRILGTVRSDLREKGINEPKATTIITEAVKNIASETGKKRLRPTGAGPRKRTLKKRRGGK